MRNLIQRTAKKAVSRKVISASTEKKLNRSAVKFYEEGWATVWSMPKEILVCENVAQACATVSFTAQKVAVDSYGVKLNQVADSLSNAMKKKDPRGAKSLKQLAKRYYEGLRSSLNTIPNSSTRCN